MPRFRALLLAVTLCASSALAQSGGPKPTLRPPPSSLQPLSLTLSGAASLGSYQGGTAYTLLRYYRNHRALLEGEGEDLARRQPYAVEETGRVYSLEAITGTSAGAANATIAGLMWCASQDDADSFRSNLFRDVWIPASIEDLLPATPEGYAPMDGLLSTRAFQPGLQAIARHIYNDALRPGCHVPLGITVTRSTPARLTVGDSLEFATSQYVATVDMGAGEGGRVELAPRNIGSGRLIARELVFPRAQGGIDKLHILKTIKASAAIPGVFEAELLNHCVGGEEIPPGEELPEAPGCPPERPYLRQDAFVDGGAFDRVPVALAVELVDQSDAGWDWDQRQPLTYLTIDPMRVRRENIQPTAPSTTSRGLAALVAFTSDFVVVARQTELLQLYQQRQLDGAREILRPLERGLPVFGRYMGNFGAVLDQGFREYDWFTGVYEGLRHLAIERWMDRMALGTGRRLAPVSNVGPFSCQPGEEPPPDPTSTRAFACSLPSFVKIATELGLLKDDEVAGLLGAFYQWELARMATPEEAAAVAAAWTGWPMALPEAWERSPLRILLTAQQEVDHQAVGKIATNVNAFLELLLDLRRRGYPFENKSLQRDPEAYLYRLARRALARLEDLELSEQPSDGPRTVGQRLTLGALRAATAAVPAPSAPRDTLEAKRVGAAVLLPNYLDFNVLQGGADLGWESRILDLGGVGLSVAAEPLAWKRTSGITWQGTMELGWVNMGFNRVTALRAGVLLEGDYLAQQPVSVGFRVSGRFLANRLQVGLEAPLWVATPGLPLREEWPSRIELTVGFVDARGVRRVGASPTLPRRPEGGPP